MQYTGGKTVASTYLPQGNLNSLFSSAGWDVLYVQASSYDAAGRLLNRTFGNGVESTFTFNEWAVQGGRLEQVSSATTIEPIQTRQDLSYTYDAVGNLTNIVDGVVVESLTFTYDALDRLETVRGLDPDDYAYDAQGRLATKSGLSYTYTDTDHIHAVTDAGTSHYTYDANGNMTGRPFDGVSYTLTYDAENRLVGISGGGLSASYSYDGDGQRVKSSVEDGEGTHATGYIGDYFEVALGTPIDPPAGDPPDCATSYCMFFPMVQGGMSAPEGQAWVSYYYAGGQRVAERVQSNTQELDSGLYYFLSDRLGCTTHSQDVNGCEASLRSNGVGSPCYNPDDALTLSKSSPR
jgi:uncharacterized protein RhaS with RHS repeats